MTLIQTFELIRDFSPINITTDICNSFYRATRVHSADYAVARCPSVRPSHAGIESKRLHVSSNFSPSGSPAILVFPYQTGWQYSDGGPPNGATNTRG